MARDLSRGTVTYKEFFVLFEEFRGQDVIGAHQVNITIEGDSEVWVSFGSDDYRAQLVDVIPPVDVPEEWIEALAAEQLEKHLEEQ